ncbi:hypothetical protein CDAR_602031 [Caerostris darwini]|uniref:Uncharacterized protein n=1 Tax=Caerostris darwini TaxID=1538125 RepID=A0AAV4REZ3_9ARAC|nr:hypothetical protein CDAR_602031 [Caerostris darwini]
MLFFVTTLHPSRRNLSCSFIHLGGLLSVINPHLSSRTLLCSFILPEGLFVLLQPSGRTFKCSYSTSLREDMRTYIYSTSFRMTLLCSFILQKDSLCFFSLLGGLLSVINPHPSSRTLLCSFILPEGLFVLLQPSGRTFKCSYSTSLREDM